VCHLSVGVWQNTNLYVDKLPVIAVIEIMNEGLALIFTVDISCNNNLIKALTKGEVDTKYIYVVCLSIQATLLSTLCLISLQLVITFLGWKANDLNICDTISTLKSLSDDYFLEMVLFTIDDIIWTKFI